MSKKDKDSVEQIESTQPQPTLNPITITPEVKKGLSDYIESTFIEPLREEIAGLESRLSDLSARMEDRFGNTNRRQERDNSDLESRMDTAERHINALLRKTGA